MSESTQDRYKNATAILLAVITVVGALVTWRASVSDDGAGDEDYAGIAATLNAEQARTLEYSEGMEDYGSFVYYERFKRAADAFEAAAEKGGASKKSLEEEATAAGDLAEANIDQFPNEFMTRKGTFSLKRDLGSKWQKALKDQDMDGESHFAEADRLRQKTWKLSAAVVVLSLALVLLTLVEIVAVGLQPLVLGVATLVGVAGTLWAVLTEVAK